MVNNWQTKKLGEVCEVLLPEACLQNMVVTYPKSFHEQHRIVTRLDALSADTKKLEAIYKQKISNLGELKKSVLKRAFNGAL